MKIKFYHYLFWNILIHIEKRKLFRKELNKYILDNNNRIIIINPFNKNDEQDVLYKIPYKHEKEIMVMDL